MHPFDLYFATIVGFQYHPGAGVREHARMSLRECAEIAAQCVVIREEVLCQVGELLQAPRSPR